MGSIAFLLWFVSIAACIAVAKQKGRSGIRWFFPGLFFGFIALICLTAIPTKRTGEEKWIDTRQGRRRLALGAIVLAVFQISVLLIAIGTSDGVDDPSPSPTSALISSPQPVETEVLQSTSSPESSRPATLTPLPTRASAAVQAPITTATPTPSATATPSPTPTAVPTPTATATPTPTTAATLTPTVITASTPSATATPTPTRSPEPQTSARFSSRGSAQSEGFQLVEGRYKLSLAVDGNSEAAWRLELFRRPGEVLLLEGAGKGTSVRGDAELLVEDSSWDLWFRIDVADAAEWSVRLTRVGDLLTPTPRPTLTPQPTATPRPTPTPTSTPTPRVFQSCQDVPESLIVVDSQGRRAVPRDLVPSAPDGDNDGFACGGQLGFAPTPTAEVTRTPPPTRTPRTFQSCQDVPESLIVVDTQGRRAVPRDLVPSAPDGDNDGFACGGQLELAPKPATTQRIQTLRNTVSLEFTQTMLPSIQTAAAYAEQRNWRLSGNYMELAAGSCDLARDAIDEIASISTDTVWDSVASHVGRACRAYWNVASALHAGNIDAAARSLDTATTALQRATSLVPLF